MLVRQRRARARPDLVQALADFMAAQVRVGEALALLGRGR
jgi:hypothetical protein